MLGSRLLACRQGGTWMLALLVAVATLRRMLELGGSPAEQSEVVARLAALLRSRGLSLGIRAQAEADQGDEAAAARDRRAAADARAEAIARYREFLKKYPDAPRIDE